ncbi:MAG: acyltransferase [Opitutaceae bacterium]|jgi:acetyltransferase-like isoleucine patch superfamily enzyme|nr:acyltransferase [Opitutaceae bacterium]
MMVQSILIRLERLGSALRVALARACGAEIGEGCHLEPGADLRPGLDLARRGRVRVSLRCRFARGVTLRPYGGSISVGRDTFLGEGVVIYGHGGVEIGDECLVAMHCRILSSEHTLAPAGVAVRTQPDIPKPTRLGRDVWLGAGVTVTAGVTIGEGCVIGAGAVVTRDLPPFAIAVGAPARVIGNRPSA